MLHVSIKTFIEPLKVKDNPGRVQVDLCIRTMKSIYFSINAGRKHVLVCHCLDFGNKDAKRDDLRIKLGTDLNSKELSILLKFPSHDTKVHFLISFLAFFL